MYNSFKWLNSIILDPLSNNALQSTCGKPIIVSNTSGQHLTVKFKGRERGEGLKKLKSNQCVGWVYFIFDNFIAMVFYLYFFQQNYPREKVRKCMHKYIFFLFTYNCWLAVILKLVVLDLPFLCLCVGTLFLSEWKSVQPEEGLVRVNWKAWHSYFFESCSNPCIHLIISTVITKKYNFVPLT